MSKNTNCIRPNTPTRMPTRPTIPSGPERQRSPVQQTAPWSRPRTSRSRLIISSEIDDDIHCMMDNHTDDETGDRNDDGDDNKSSDHVTDSDDDCHGDWSDSSSSSSDDDQDSQQDDDQSSGQDYGNDGNQDDDDDQDAEDADHATDHDDVHNDGPARNWDENGYYYDCTANMLNMHGSRHRLTNRDIAEIDDLFSQNEAEIAARSGEPAAENYEVAQRTFYDVTEEKPAKEKSFDEACKGTFAVYASCAAAVGAYIVIMIASHWPRA